MRATSKHSGGRLQLQPEGIMNSLVPLARQNIATK